MSEVRRNPKAKQALGDEWRKLIYKRESFDMKGVQEKSKVKADAIRDGRKIHLGTLMPLCHVKHSELMDALQSYKGRVVFRGTT